MQAQRAMQRKEMCGLREVLEKCGPSFESNMYKVLVAEELI